MADQSMDARRMARDQESRIAAAAAVGTQRRQATISIPDLDPAALGRQFRDGGPKL